MIVTLTNVRLAFANLFEPKQVQGKGDLRYSACFIIGPGSQNSKLVEQALTETANEKWKDKGVEIARKLIEENRVCYIRKPKTDKNGQIYQGFEDSYSVSAANKARPTVVNRDRSPLVAADGKPYSGCYVNAIIEVWGQDNQWGRRINATLKGVQFMLDGDAFGGGTPVSADAFEDLGVDEEVATAGPTPEAPGGSLF